MDDVTLIQEPVQTYTYDANGNLTATTNTEGKTSTELDSQERLKKYTAMTGVEYNLHYANNTTRNPQYMTSGGVKTSYEYESSGSVKKTTVQATAGGKKLESTTNYDSTLNFLASSTDVNGSTVTSSYNASKGTLSNSTDPRGTTTNHMYIAENDRIRLTYSTGLDALYYNYNEKGALEKLSRKSFDPNQAVFWQGYHFDYDAWGNTTEIQVWSSTSSSATPPANYNSTTLATYLYNNNGTLARMNYPNGDYVAYAYDVLDRLIEEVYYNYNDVEIARCRYVYNANGQLARQYVQKDGAETESYSFEYDSLGRLIRSREEKGTNQVQRTEHLYDTANRLTKQNWSIGATGFSESYTYDGNDGTMSAFSTSFTLPNGSTDTYKLDYSYDPLKRLEQASYRYDNNSTLLYTRNYTYLDRSGGTDLTTSRLRTYVVRDADNSVISGNRYEYDANGNITKIEEVYTLNDADAYRTTAEYTYDALNQLKRETRYTYSGSSAVPATTTTVNYTIDTAGNLRSVNGGEHSVAYTYGDNAWADLLTGITVDNVTRTINYASAGNPSNWYNGTDYTNLTWTQGRRLSSLTKGSQTYSYEYDMSGIRSVKIANGLRHEYVTQNGKVVREIVTNASTGAFQYALDFTYDEAGHPLTMRKYNNADMQTNYITMQYVCNAQGDVVKLINNGTVYAEYTYDAWGKVLTATENGSYNYAALNPLRYRGYYFDTESGFYYLQSRYYDPVLGRFLNADSYASTGHGFLGYNMLAYCNNNPIIYGDYHGDDACIVIDNDAAGGFGHVNLFVQDEEGCWYYYSFASSRGRVATALCSLVWGVKGSLVEKKLKVNAKPFTYVEDFEDFIYDNGIINTAKSMDCAIYYEGDFTATYESCSKDAQKSPITYNLFKYNCMHFAIEKLLQGNLSVKQSRKLLQVFMVASCIPNDLQSIIASAGVVLPSRK